MIKKIKGSKMEPSNLFWYGESTYQLFLIFFLKVCILKFILNVYILKTYLII